MDPTSISPLYLTHWCSSVVLSLKVVSLTPKTVRLTLNRPFSIIFRFNWLPILLFFSPVPIGDWTSIYTSRILMLVSVIPKTMDLTLILAISNYVCMSISFNPILYGAQKRHREYRQNRFAARWKHSAGKFYPMKLTHQSWLLQSTTCLLRWVTLLLGSALVRTTIFKKRLDEMSAAKEENSY